MASDLATFNNGTAGSTVRATLNTLITRFQDVVNVKDWGAAGDGSADDTAEIQAAFDYAFGTTGSPHGDTATSNRQVYFPPGNFKISAPLTIRSGKGVHIFGAGRHVSNISQVTNNTSAIVTNGFEFSVVEQLNIGTVSGGSGICFDLDWDNTGECALQSNTFRDCFFGGGAYGLSIGKSAFMGSENTIDNCYFINHNVAGLATRNGNALQQTVRGGNFAQCARAIYVVAGSVMSIDGVGFQGQTIAHIKVDNTAGDGMMSIRGCRSENINSGCYFVELHSGASAHIAGCASVNPEIFHIERSASPGLGDGALILDACALGTSTITGNGTLYIRGNHIAPRAITGAVNNGSGLARITMVSTAGIETGMSGHVSGVAGATGVNGNALVFTKISGTQLDIQSSTFGGTYTSGGLLTSGAYSNPAYLSGFSGYVAQNI